MWNRSFTNKNVASLKGIHNFDLVKKWLFGNI